MQNLVTYACNTANQAFQYARNTTNQACQYAQENPYKALAYTSFIVGTAVATVLTVNKAAEFGQSTFTSCTSYEDYHSTCDWLGFTQPDKPKIPSTVSDIPSIVFNGLASVLGGVASITYKVCETTLNAFSDPDFYSELLSNRPFCAFVLAPTMAAGGMFTWNSIKITTFAHKAFAALSP